MKNKLVALGLTLSTAVWLVAPVGAVTVEELQAQIQALLQQIAQLQQQLQQAQGGTQACFTKTLSKGMSDPEVSTLQSVLKQDPSIYPEGLVTGYFGALTEAAVKRFQAKYGIEQVGVVGPITRAKLNSLYCVTPSPTPTVSPTPSPTVIPAYGSLSIQSYPVSNPQTTLYGGNTYEVVAAQFKATGSDITIKKVGVRITDVDGADTFPWQAFTEISLWDGATKVASLSPSQSNAIEVTFADVYDYNISGLNVVVPNGQNKVLTVKATVVSGVTSTLNNETFRFTILRDSLVYTDTAGVTYTTASGNSVDSSVLTITTAQQATVTVSTAPDNPLDTNVIGSTTGPSRVDLLKFNLKVDDVSTTFNSVSGIVVTIGSTSIQPYITAIELWDGSTLVQSAAPTFTDGNDTTGEVSLSNFSLPVAAGTTKTLTLKAQIGQLPSNYVGSSSKYLYISTGPTFSGIDANSNVVSNGSTVTGNKAYLFVKAPVFTFGNAQFTSTGDQSHPQSIGNAKISFSVSAQGADIYLNTQSANSFATSSPGINGGGPNTFASGLTCTSGAYQVTNGYRIPQGSTANCEMAATLQLATTTSGAYYYVKIQQIGWDLASDFSGMISQNWGWDNFRTGLLYLAY